MSPDPVAQRILRDELALDVRQCAKHCERLGRKRHLFSGARQSRLNLIKFEAVEAESCSG
jgi:hypothetical protein